MIRIVIEYALLFLLPSMAYVAYIAFVRNDWPGLGQVLAEAPLLKLFASGSALILAAVMLFSTYSGHRPRESYTPPAFENGKVEPGHGADGAPSGAR